MHDNWWNINCPGYGKKEKLTILSYLVFAVSGSATIIVKNISFATDKAGCKLKKICLHLVHPAENIQQQHAGTFKKQWRSNSSTDICPARSVMDSLFNPGVIKNQVKEKRNKRADGA